MECECAKRVGYLVSGGRRRARQTEVRYQRRLDLFKKGIVEGALELVGRHLYRAGVYQASLDNEFTRNPGASAVLASLSSRLSETDQDMYRFYEENRLVVEQQRDRVDPEGLLGGVLRRKEKAAGLLEGNILRELNQVKVLVERMRRLDEYLESWRASLRMEARVEVYKIVDMHS